MAITGALPSIRHTKLFRPPLMEDYVMRPQLRDRLTQVGRRPLTIVCAPAGYGKSVLMSAWLAQCDCHSAWLSLDENDNDLGAFESYLVAALHSAIPSLDDELMTVLSGSTLPPTAVFVEMLFGEFSRLEKDVFLVIDDYGVITNDDIHELITELMRHPHPRLHLILGSRYNPPFPLSEWRVRDQLVEIRSIDLRFSLEESGTFLQRVIDVPLDEDTIKTVHARTEGWIAGLRLAALSFSHMETFRGQIDQIGSNNTYISDYLFSQVLTR